MFAFQNTFQLQIRNDHLKVYYLLLAYMWYVNTAIVTKNDSGKKFKEDTAGMYRNYKH